MAEGGEGEDEIQFLRTVSAGVASCTSTLAWGRAPGPCGRRAAGGDGRTLPGGELWGEGRRHSVCGGRLLPGGDSGRQVYAAPPPRGSPVRGSGAPALSLSTRQRVLPVSAGGGALTSRSLCW